MMLVAVLATTARAGAPAAERTWYGLPATIAGGAASGCLLVTAKVDNLGAGVGCILIATGALFVAPLVHHGRGHKMKAGVSAVLQVGGLIGSVVLVNERRDHCDGPGGNQIDGCEREPTWFVLPMLGAAALDSGLLSWDRRAVPQVALTPGGAMVGVAMPF